MVIADCLPVTFTNSTGRSFETYDAIKRDAATKRQRIYETALTGFVESRASKSTATTAVGAGSNFPLGVTTRRAEIPYSRSRFRAKYFVQVAAEELRGPQPSLTDYSSVRISIPSWRPYLIHVPLKRNLFAFLKIRASGRENPQSLHYAAGRCSFKNDALGVQDGFGARCI